ncbi:MAG: N-carbamoylputrescine amidase [Desulfovibrionaceae bacterium]|jgi:N-carbamoylputrescine amidase|nr:N-carbamoylputrescine amidase [Desulfovibrionaceae bacterium]
MSLLTVALVQMACGPDAGANADRCETLVREAAAAGANLVLPPELFAHPYFCKDQDSAHFALAEEAATSGLVARFAALAAELGVVLPVSFFERAGQAFYNSAAMIDADGTVLGVYRKSHIPDGPGYQEKYYFSPGDTGFRVWPTRVGRVGLGICWDQWFPEAARAMALLGAEILLYPTAIGSEPADEGAFTRDRWRRVMQGHAVANHMPVAAANRVGSERGATCAIEFYGSSFVAGHDGAVAASLDETQEGVALATFDLDTLARGRAEWGFFRDRRPGLYGPLLTRDGVISCSGQGRAGRGHGPEGDREK